MYKLLQIYINQSGAQINLNLSIVIASHINNVGYFEMYLVAFVTWNYFTPRQVQTFIVN